MTRYATIGTSSIVDSFLAAGRSVPGFDHTVVYSRDRARGEEFAHRHGHARVVTSIDALAEAPDVDVVYIASPNALHHPQAKPLLEASKHVLVEKAAAANAAEFRDLLTTAHAHNVVIVESIRSLFDPSHAQIRDLLPRLGAVRRVTFSYCQRSRRYDQFLAGQPVNIFDPALAAGGLMDIGTYCANPLISLFGRPDRITAAAFPLANGIDGLGTILCSYPDKIAEVQYSKITNSDGTSQIQGEDATLLIDTIHDPRELVLINKDHTRETIRIDKPLPQQAYVLTAMDALIKEPSLAEPYNQTSLAALELMDTARHQIGVRFPADQ